MVPGTALHTARVSLVAALPVAVAVALLPPASGMPERLALVTRAWSGLWIVCAVTLLVAAIGTAWPWLAIRGVTAELGFGRRRCFEHELVTVTLTVTNPCPWPVWGLLFEQGFLHQKW